MVNSNEVKTRALKNEKNSIMLFEIFDISFSITIGVQGCEIDVFRSNNEFNVTVQWRMI